MNVLVLGSRVRPVEELAAALGGELDDVPALVADPEWSWADALDRWREEAGAGPAAETIVVAPWEAVLAPRHLEAVDTDEWIRRYEVPTARWFAALGAAARRCVAGGSIVAVVERPAPLDCAGWAPETAVAEGVAALARSLARGEGGRRVRVNVVTTPVRTTQPPVVDPPPALTTFPGTIGVEVVGAVRALLGQDAAGITGTVVHADCGRSW